MEDAIRRELRDVTGLDFRDMDEGERGWYLAEEGHGAWICEGDGLTFTVEMCDGIWGAQIDFQLDGEHDSVLRAWAGYETPEQAARDAWEEYRGRVA